MCIKLSAFKTSTNNICFVLKADLGRNSLMFDLFFLTPYIENKFYQQTKKRGGACKSSKSDSQFDHPF